jgi:putative protein-disulfide isomerase
MPIGSACAGLHFLFNKTDFHMLESAADLPELIYMQDPLCAWCYGMSPVIAAVQQAYAGRLTVSVLCGGMAVGESATAGAGWASIGSTLELVARTTGVEFGAAFRQELAKGTWAYDSELPSRAIVAFRQLAGDPARAVGFAHEIQLALFRDGKNLHDPATYDVLVAAAGLDGAAFHQLLARPETEQATRQEFAAVARTGVQALPTTVLRLQEQGYVLARGYQPFRVLQQGLEQLLAEQLRA